MESYTYTLEELVTALYDLDRTELRRLVWEALLISDGPGHVDGEVASAAIGVEADAKYCVFKVWER
jgi:hypothetical protein